MKKASLIIAFITIATLVFYACGNDTSKDTSSKMKEMKTVYTCSMHPEVISDKPGSCPKCGMELVKKEVTFSDSSHVQHHSDSLMQN